jgi:Uma2 family endonuclease
MPDGIESAVERVADDATMASVLGVPRGVTYRDLQGWPDDGRRYELHDGEVVVVPAPLPRHQIAMLELAGQLRAFVRQEGGIVLVSPIDIVFNQTNVLQPDIVVFTAARRHHVRLDEPICGAPDLVVEVLSPGTAGRDRGRKLRTFEQFRVQEYWIVDPLAECIQMHTLRQDRFELTSSSGREDDVRSGVLPGFSCAAETIFPW